MKTNTCTEGEISEEMRIDHGFRQGCVLLPLLFTMYSEKIFKEAPYELELGTLINSKRIKRMRYVIQMLPFQTL